MNIHVAHFWLMRYCWESNAGVAKVLVLALHKLIQSELLKTRTHLQNRLRGVEIWYWTTVHIPELQDFWVQILSICLLKTSVWLV